MSTTKSNCSLCNKSDILYKFKYIATHIHKAFFTQNRSLFQKAIVNKIQLCIICAYKLELSWKIMREYENMHIVDDTLSTKNCSLCEEKATPLININENPNEVQDKFSVFLNSAKIKSDYKDLKSCLKCLYNLCVWFEVRTKLYEIMKISDSDTVENNDNKPVHISANINDAKTLPNTKTPRESETTPRKSSRNKQNEIKNLAENHLTTNNINTAAPRSSTRVKGKSNTPTDTTEAKWHKYLTRKFKTIKTVNKLIEKENITLNVSNIENDDKLLNGLPIVEIFGSSQISNGGVLQGNTTNPPTIIVSDSDEKPVNPRRSKRKIQKIRFKLSMKSRLSLIKPSVVAVNEEQDNSLESEETVEITDTEDNFMCNVCDKTFTVKCEFLMHKLKHDKMEDVVNVHRHQLPETLNVAELSPNKVLEGRASTPQNITKLLTKWLGEHAAKIYTEADSHGSKQMDNETIKEADDITQNLSTASEDKELEQSEPQDSANKSDEEKQTGNEEDDDETDIDTEPSNQIDDDSEEVDINNANVTNNITEKDNTDVSSVNDCPSEDLSNQAQTNNAQDVVTGEKKLGESETNENESDVIDSSEYDNEVEIIDKEQSNNADDKELKCNDENKAEEKDSLQLIEHEVIIESSNEDCEEINLNLELDTSGDDLSSKEKTIDEERISEEAKAKCEKDKDNKLEVTESGLKPIDDKVLIHSDKVMQKKYISQLGTSGCEFSDEDLIPPPVMTCEDLLNILETNVDSDVDTSHDTIAKESAKRKRESETEEKATPRKKKKISDSDTVENNDNKPVHISANINDAKTLPNTKTPRESETTPRKSSRNKQNEIKNSAANHLTTNNINTTAPRSPTRVKGKSNTPTGTTEAKWHKYLTRKFKTIQTVNKLIEKENITLNVSNIENDDKLFDRLPIVEIFRSSQISNGGVLQGNTTNTPTIIVSDSDEKTVNTRRSRRKLSLKNNTSRTTRKKRKIQKIRFKLPMKSRLSLIKPSVVAVNEEQNNSESEETVEITDTEDNFMCNVCDKTFTVKCEFLVHKLKHDKMEDVVVNVHRHQLPETLNVAELSPNKVLEGRTSTPQNITKLLTKWLGEHAAKIYTEADSHGSKQMDNETIKADDITQNLSTASEDKELAQSEPQDSANKSDEEKQRGNEEDDDETDIDTEPSNQIDDDSKKVDEHVNETIIDTVEDPESENENQETDGKDDEVIAVDTECSGKVNDDSEEVDINNANVTNNIAEKDNTDVSSVNDSASEDLSNQAQTNNAQDVVTGEKKLGESETNENESDVIDFSDYDNEVEIIDKEQSNNADDKELECNDENKAEEKDSPQLIEHEVIIETSKEDCEEINLNLELDTSGDDLSSKEKTIDEEIISEEAKDNCEKDKDNKLKVTESSLKPIDDKVLIHSDKVVQNKNISQLVTSGCEFSDEDLIPPPVMTCEDLLNILETNVDSDVDTSHDTIAKESAKRKRESETAEEATPRKKKVRFSNEKEIFTTDKSEVQFEKITDDLFLTENEEINEK